MLTHLLSPDMVQTVLDALPTPVFFKDRQGVYRGCNRAFAELMGRRADELAGLTVFDMAPPDLAQTYAEADEALMREGGEQRYEAQIQPAHGPRRHVMFHKAVLRDDTGAVSGLVGTILDITERKALETRLAHLAQYDPLTGLLNRRAILAHLEALHHDRRGQGQPVCLMMCDVDHFKSINDRYGHAVGDEVLRHVAHVLRAHLRDADALGRIGGEEFLVVLDSADLEQASQVAHRLRQAMASTAVATGNRNITVTISVGVAQSLAGDEDWASVIARADDGLYAAKHAGRDRVMVMTAPAATAPASMRGLERVRSSA